MADVVAPNGPPDPASIGIWNAITSFTPKVMKLAQNNAMLGHNGDSISLALPAGWIGCGVRLVVTERVFENGKVIDSKKHEPKLFNLGYGTGPGTEQTRTITLTGETQTVKGIWPLQQSYHTNIDYYVSLDMVRVSFKNAEGLFDEANIVPVQPPPPGDGDGNDVIGEFPWWIVGVAIAAAVAIVVIWYFYRRRVSIPGPAAPAVDCPPPCGTGGK